MVSGAFLGGFARGFSGAGQNIVQGFATGARVAQNRAALELEQDKREQAAIDQQTAFLRDDLKTLSSLIEKAAGRSQEAALRFVDVLSQPNSRGMSQLDLLAARGQGLGKPFSTEMLLQNFTAVALSGESAEDRKRATQEEAEGKVAEIETIAKGLEAPVSDVAQAQGFLPAPTEGKRLLSPDEIRAAGFRPGTVVEQNTTTGDLEVVQNPVQPQAAQTLTFKMPDNSFREVNARDPAAVNTAISDGGVQVNLSVQAQSLQGLNLTEIDPDDIGAVREALQDSDANIEALQSTLEAFQKTPQAGGLMGTVIERGGGVLRQLGAVGRFAADAIGADEETAKRVQDARTKARITTSRMLTTVTQEESRFTDTERRIAAETLQTLEETSDPVQIQQALQTALDIMSKGEIREALKLLNAADLDIMNIEDAEKFMEILKKNQFTDERALDLILDLQERASR